MNEEIVKILENLPKRKLSRFSDLKLRFRLRMMMLKKGLPNLPSLSLAQMAYTYVVFMLILTTSTSAYAYSSNEVTAGDFLYPVKLEAEKIELSLNENNSADKHLKFASRRLREAQYLIENKGGESRNLTITLLELHKEIVDAEDIDDGIGQEISQEYVSDLEKLTEKIPTDRDHGRAIRSINKTLTLLEHEDDEDDEDANEEDMAAENFVEEENDSDKDESVEKNKPAYSGNSKEQKKPSTSIEHGFEKAATYIRNGIEGFEKKFNDEPEHESDDDKERSNSDASKKETGHDSDEKNESEKD